MGKIQNPAVLGASGTLDKTIVYRRWRGQTIMAGRPKRTKDPSANQKAVTRKFLRAVNYAKYQMDIPEAKALYEKGISATKYSAHNVAMSDFLVAPEVHEIDTEGYKGVAGDIISIIATDDFQVTAVKVVITGSDGVMLESGDASLDVVTQQVWKYVVTTQNAQLTGTKIKATAFDRPGNKGYLEKVL